MDTAIEYEHFKKLFKDHDGSFEASTEIENIDILIPQMNIDYIQLTANETAHEHGWWDNNRSFGELIALGHSEFSEALEEYRLSAEGAVLSYMYFSPSGKPEGVGVELADVIIRVADMAQEMGIDLRTILHIKMLYNDTRPYRHGDKRI